MDSESLNVLITDLRSFLLESDRVIASDGLVCLPYLGLLNARAMHRVVRVLNKGRPLVLAPDHNPRLEAAWQEPSSRQNPPAEHLTDIRRIREVLNKAAKIALGACLLTLGGIWYPMSYAIVSTAYGGGWNPVAFLALALVATALVTVGIGLLVYGVASPAQPSQG